MSDKPPRKSKTIKPQRSHGHLLQWRWWRRLVLWLFLAVTATVTIAGCFLYLHYSALASTYDLSKLGLMPERTVVYDRNKQPIGRLYGENRIVVPLSEVSPWFTKALLAREDTRFYLHHGVDYYGILRALVRDVKDRKVVQGASTITMQLARNSFPGLDDRSLHRKLVEVMLAHRIEKANNKDQILEHYMNRVFLGNGLYGIQRAATVYFGKHASQLSLGEAAMIAGIIRGPTRFSPFKNWEGAKQERNDVLKRMVITHMITQAQADAAMQENIALRAQPAFQSQGDYAMDAIKRNLDIILEEKDFEDGGLQVFTTIDKELQTAAEESLEKRASAVEKLKGYPRQSKAQFDAKWDHVSDVPATPYLQGAVTALDNKTGGILAIVGGRDYRQSQYNRAMQGERQIGSTIKPFIYAAAMARGLLPGTLVDDSPIPGDWSPGNSDGKFIGMQPMALGLIQSRNTMTVRVGDQAGRDYVMQLLRDAGIGEHPDKSRQVFIGNAGASLRQLTSAFSIFPNQGLRHRPYLIERIEDRHGNVVFSTPVLDAEVLTPGVAAMTSRLLSHVLNEGTAAAARTEYGFKSPGGGKTGTTNDYKDAWFVGYTQGVTCGVWMGLDKPETIMDAAYGAKLSLPVWVDVMKKAEELKYLGEPPPEVPFNRVKLCRNSSLLATDACQAAGALYEDDLPYELIPQAFCQVHGVGGTTYGGSQPQQPRESGGFWNRVKGWFR